MTDNKYNKSIIAISVFAAVVFVIGCLLSVFTSTPEEEQKEPVPNTPVFQFTSAIDTSTPETVLKLNEQEYRYTFANDLAEKLLKFIHDKLQENGQTLQDISQITFMSGPGSFTGLRIGATIVNTLASELNIPLYDHHGKKHQLSTHHS